jgi:hypothetical protein
MVGREGDLVAEKKVQEQEKLFFLAQLPPVKMHNSRFFSLFTGLCRHHHSQFKNIFITLKETR